MEGCEIYSVRGGATLGMITHNASDFTNPICHCAFCSPADIVFKEREFPDYTLILVFNLFFVL